MNRTLFTLMLSALILSWASSGWAADFRAVAKEVGSDLIKAEQEHKDTQKRLAQKEAELKKRLGSLKAELANEQARLKAARRELDRLRQARAELSLKLSGQKAEMKELAGLVRASARDMLALAERSPVTAEHPQRLKELRSYLDKTRFPGLADIKKLVDIHLVEITATGRINRRRGSFVDLQGREASGELVRLGGFNTLYENGGSVGYAALGPGTGRLLAVGGEVSWWLGRNLRAYLSGESPAVYMDISNGAALSQLSREQGWWDQLLSGGPLIWPILFVGLVGLILILERLLFLQRVRSNTDALMDNVNRQVAAGDFDGALGAAKAHAGRPTSNVIQAGLALRGSPAEVIESGLAEAMFKELPRLERFLTTLKVLAAVAPLLGLLGTVTGMINTFQVITTHGSGDPRLLAGGISEALITTQLGLAVAIPVMVAAALLTRKAQRITSDMEEKAVALSAALIKVEN